MSEVNLQAHPDGSSPEAPPVTPGPDAVEPPAVLVSLLLVPPGTLVELPFELVPTVVGAVLVVVGPLVWVEVTGSVLLLVVAGLVVVAVLVVAAVS